MKVREVKVRKALTPSGLPDVNLALNPYVGCYHGCVYCYARLYVRDEEIAKRWGEVIAVKVNLPELLAREARKGLGIVGLGTVTDPYQPLERKYRLTRRSLKILLKRGLEVSIQTKSDLILRDLDLLSTYAEKVDVGFTITTTDPRIASKMEPKAPTPKSRIKALEELSSVGIRTWLFLGPIIPGYNDNLDSIEELIEVASSTNSILYYDKLRVKEFMLDPNHPLYEAAEKAKAYPWASLFKVIRSLCRRMEVKCAPGLSYLKPKVRDMKLDGFL